MKTTNIKSIFPIFAVENGLLISKYADISLVYKLSLPQIYSLSKDDMNAIGVLFDKVIRGLPENTIFQKQDFFFIDQYDQKLSNANSILEKSDNAFFFEKPTMTHECYVTITLDSGNKASIANNSKKLESHLENVERFIYEVNSCLAFFTKDDYFELERLDTDGIITLLEKYYSLSKNGGNKLSDIFINKSLRVGDNLGEMYAITSNEELPLSIENVIKNKEYSTQKTDFWIPYIQGLCLGLECNHIYNQVIYIDESNKIFNALKIKMNNFNSLSLLSTENVVMSDNINDLVEDVIDNELKFIRQHFNVIIWDDSPRKLTRVKNNLESVFRERGMTPYHVKFGLQEYFIGSSPGAATFLPNEQKFIGISEQTSCLINFESYYESYKDGILLTDRKNDSPIRIDLWDEPVRRGHIANRNRLIFGPSGTGKSFLVNHIASQYYEQGHHIVMIDIGNSYKKLCHLLDGQYFEYDLDRPLEFNPFYIYDKEIDTDKKEFLISLILFLWKGNSPCTNEEKQIITMYVDNYYAKVLLENKIKPSMKTFYEFVMEHRVEYNEEKYFDKLSFDLSVREFYDGKYAEVLNAEEPVNLTDTRFIVFEMDNIKDHPILFPLVTMLSVDVVMNKIKNLPGAKKSIFIDECWKPISSGNMADFIKYLYKTVRKHYGEVAIATQDVEDILESPAGPAMINNTDTLILLSHKRKMASKDKFQKNLSLSNSDLDKLYSTEKREVFIKIGQHSNVYKVNVSRERYACYTSSAEENKYIFDRYNEHKNMKLAINEFVNK